MSRRAVVWHDLECGSYTADLPLWRELAAIEAGPVLEIGAGTGRVALDLAAHGHAVTALDRDRELLAALDERAGGTVRTVCADAQAFDLGAASFGLIIVPMQTIQLLADRFAFLRAARRHLAPGGLLAAAVADALEGFDPSTAILPRPEVTEAAGWHFASQAVAVREHADRSTIERIRTTLAPDGARTAEADATDLARVTPASLAAQAACLGLAPEPPALVEATDEHVGSEVALLRG